MDRKLRYPGCRQPTKAAFLDQIVRSNGPLLDPFDEFRKVGLLNAVVDADSPGFLHLYLYFHFFHLLIDSNNSYRRFSHDPIEVLRA